MPGSGIRRGDGTERISADTTARQTKDRGKFEQVSRLGNPLVNEAIVPAHLKDFSNRSTPDRDGQFLPKVQDPEVPALIGAIYMIPNPNELDQANATKRNDLVAGFLTGFSRDVFASTFGGLGAGVDADLNSLDLNAVSPTPAPAEHLRLNVNVPPTAEPNRLGVGARGCPDPAGG